MKWTGGDCEGCGTPYEQCSREVAAHNDSGCCELCRNWYCDPHNVHRVEDDHV